MKPDPSNAWGRTRPNEDAADISGERYLTLLAEGAAMNVPVIDSVRYEEFRARVTKLSQRLPDRLPDEEKAALLRSILHEFESYRAAAEDEVRKRLAAWKTLASTAFIDLIRSLGIESGPHAVSISKEMLEAGTADEIENCHEQLKALLHPAGPESAPAEAVSLKAADFSTANHNAAGLRGGGTAIEHLRSIKANDGGGFVVIFHLGALTMVQQRFGAETVQDCLMAVSAFLTENLRRNDAVYHWSDSSLLAILQDRATEQILSAELEHMAMKNNETTVVVAGKPTMLRIPINFEIYPIEKLQSSDDLQTLALLTSGRRNR
jgi:GGDEF domain-containing protein